MALQSNTQIVKGSIPIYAYKQLMLHQEIDSHHSLELICRMDVLENVSDDMASYRLFKSMDVLSYKGTYSISKGK